MNLLQRILVACILPSLIVSSTTACAKPKKKPSVLVQNDILGDPNSEYRGWDYIAGKLAEAGVSERDINAVYKDPRMPRFSFIPFKLKPREAHRLYTNFQKPFYHKLGANFIAQHQDEFAKLERQLGVPAEVVTAILVIETQIGRHLGDDLVIYRLSRVASVLDPNNVKENYRRLRDSDPSVTFEEVVARGHYLEDTFLPEIPALINIAKRNEVNIFNIHGSTAGAFGIPQFLPTTLLKYGMDGDGDGHVSLYNEVDAMWSAGNFLSTCGFTADLPIAEKKKVIWQYNKSEAYIDAVLQMSEEIRAVSM